MAQQTSQTLLHKAKEEATAEIGQLSHEIDKQRQFLRDEALEEARREGETIRAREEAKRQRLREQYELHRERVKEQLTKEVFDFGDR